MKRKTRDILINTAVSLMADRGVNAVSLTEVLKAAGQRNASAMQYHFGDKDGLIQAIFDKHAPAIAARRQERLDNLGSEPLLRELVEILVLPTVEELDNPEGGRDYLRLIARIQYHELKSQHPQDRRENIPLQELERLLAARLQNLPPLEVEYRMLTVRDILLNGLAHYCERISRDPACDQQQRPVFTRHLIDAITAVLAQ